MPYGDHKASSIVQQGHNLVDLVKNTFESRSVLVATRPETDQWPHQWSYPQTSGQISGWSLRPVVRSVVRQVWDTVLAQTSGQISGLGNLFWLDQCPQPGGLLIWTLVWVRSGAMTPDLGARNPADY